MPNIIITTAAAIITITVPAGAMISVADNDGFATKPVEITSKTGADDIVPQPIDQPITVVVEIQSADTAGPTPFPDPNATPLPTPLPTTPILNPIVDSNGVPEPQSVLPTDGRTIAAPQPTINDFSNLPQPRVMLNNGTANPSIPPTAQQPTNVTQTQSSQEVQQLRDEVAQLRQALAQQNQTTTQPQNLVLAQPTPNPQNTITETTVIDPVTNLPTQRVITSQQVGVVPTPVPPKVAVVNNSQIGRGTSITNSASGFSNSVGNRGFGNTQFQQQTTAAARAAQPRTTTAPVGAIPSASAAQTVR